MTIFSKTLKRKEKGGGRFVPSSSFRPVDAISMHGGENPGYFIQQKIFTGNPRNPWNLGNSDKKSQLCAFGIERDSSLTETRHNEAHES